MPGTAGFECGGFGRNEILPLGICLGSAPDTERLIRGKNAVNIGKPQAAIEREGDAHLDKPFDPRKESRIRRKVARGIFARERIVGMDRLEAEWEVRDAAQAGKSPETVGEQPAILGRCRNEEGPFPSGRNIRRIGDAPRVFQPVVEDFGDAPRHVDSLPKQEKRLRAVDERMTPARLADAIAISRNVCRYASEQLRNVREIVECSERL